MTTDDALVRRTRAAFAHRERLLRIAFRRTDTIEDAEDVVGEALTRCLEFDHLDDARLGPFLTSVTIRLCADERGRQSVANRNRHRLLAADAEADPGERACDRAEAQWVVRSVVATLPARQREVLAARAAGMSCAAIAMRYRMSYKAVESTLSRARATARAILAAS